MENPGKTNPTEFLRELRERKSNSKTPPTADEESIDSADDSRVDRPFVNSGRGGVVRQRRATMPDVVQGHAQLAELFERVNTLLGDVAGDDLVFAPSLDVFPEPLQESKHAMVTATNRECQAHFMVGFLSVLRSCLITTSVVISANVVRRPVQ